MDPASISPAVADADAVITAIAPHGTGPSTLRQDSTHSIIQAMRKTGARRLLFISGSIVADEGESPYLRYLIKPVARHTFLRHGHPPAHLRRQLTPRPGTDHGPGQDRFGRAEALKVDGHRTRSQVAPQEPGK
jgi:nucleoside-diphosphate-sugar epimerase